MKKQILEKEVKREVRKLLEVIPKRHSSYRNYRVIHPKIAWFMPISGVYGKKGVADFIGCSNGKAFAIETKSSTGKQTLIQKVFQEDWEAAGGKYWLVSPHNFNVFSAEFEDFIVINY